MLILSGLHISGSAQLDRANVYFYMPTAFHVHRLKLLHSDHDKAKIFPI